MKRLHDRFLFDGEYGLLTRSNRGHYPMANPLRDGKHDHHFPGACSIAYALIEEVGGHVALEHYPAYVKLIREKMEARTKFEITAEEVDLFLAQERETRRKNKAA